MTHGLRTCMANNFSDNNKIKHYETNTISYCGKHLTYTVCLIHSSKPPTRVGALSISQRGKSGLGKVT